jgi:hypothetical protein
MTVQPVYVPFEEIGVESDDGNLVLAAVQAFVTQHPARSIPITEVSQSSGVPGPTVKCVLFALLALNCLKSTFRPRHRECDHIVGRPEQSVRIIQEKALEGQYWCPHCMHPVDGPEDIDIEILFRKPGTYAA